MGGISRCLALQIVVLIAGAHGANILGLFTSLSPSHLVIQMSMARILAERGHNVTVVTILKPPSLHKDINHILVPMEEDILQAFNSVVVPLPNHLLLQLREHIKHFLHRAGLQMVLL